MSNYLDSQSGWLPPVIDANAPGNLTPQVISGTGTSEESNSRPFAVDRMHWLIVGNEPVRVGFSAKGDLTDAIDSTNGVILPAGYVFSFKAFGGPDWGARYVYVEAADGSAEFEVSVIQREP